MTHFVSQVTILVVLAFVALDCHGLYAPRPAAKSYKGHSLISAKPNDGEKRSALLRIITEDKGCTLLKVRKITPTNLCVAPSALTQHL